jgi:hypothetical protein
MFKTRLVKTNFNLLTHQNFDRLQLCLIKFPNSSFILLHYQFESKKNLSQLYFFILHEIHFTKKKQLTNLFAFF